MDVIFDARNPDEFEAFRLLCIRRIAARNKWSFEIACKYAALTWALTHPAVITVANVLETGTRRFKRELLELLSIHRAVTHNSVIAAWAKAESQPWILFVQ